ncbi:carbonic anhydrase [Streptomyces inusitatus]|uniref:Carbonic anhydrase n=1 Tax=Streptomyces inusitatus TaxID=68221 RepID=A0A918UQ68_9ACTN|nr:carbonic anhydrase [Streptomyces inusitatus]GGZ26399.1 carbonic anhydrase [Streptomyces inusitatus]
MKHLLDNARNFRHRMAPESDTFRGFASGQNPGTLFITCSDSRVIPSLITGSAPGEVFELRNAGNIIPPYGPGAQSGEAATIEYAVDVLRVQDIVVCGHSHCGAVGALASDADLTELPSVAEWVAFARPALAPMLGTPPDDLAFADYVQRHVSAQLETLRGYPKVQNAINEGRLELHGWYYRVDTAEVLELDELRGEFHQN